MTGLKLVMDGTWAPVVVLGCADFPVTFLFSGMLDVLVSFHGGKIT